MEVELDTFAGRIVHPFDLADRGHGLDVEQVVMFVGVEDDVASRHDGHAVFEVLGEGVAGLSPRKDLAGPGVGVVGHREVEDLAAAVSRVDDIDIEDFAPDDDLSVVDLQFFDGLRHVADLFAVDHLRGLEVERDAVHDFVGLFLELLFRFGAGFLPGLGFRLFLHVRIGGIVGIHVHDAGEFDLEPVLVRLGQDGLEGDVGADAFEQVGASVGQVQGEFMAVQFPGTVVQEPVGRGTAALQFLQEVGHEGQVDGLRLFLLVLVLRLVLRVLKHSFDIIQLEGSL